MKLNPYKLISFQIEKDGMLKARRPAIFQEDVRMEREAHEFKRPIK